ncbi:hypothetical protein R5R35_010515 [Gryllus longicercus]|uniref:Mutator-like transposase domain-containing protein n=1 Tax=Gryllus longicercus TaxID=2509291 RepID=A0AAN9VEL6_9ORTH
MEVFAADILWKRSVAKCGMRYSTVLSDGDAKTFIHLVKEAVYGNDVQIEKEECINHIAKRMGIGLRNLVQEGKTKNANLGGRGRGTLKEINILKLTSYYRNAIVTNIPDDHKMKTAILANLQHYSSTDSEPSTDSVHRDKNRCAFTTEV